MLISRTSLLSCSKVIQSAERRLQRAIPFHTTLQVRFAQHPALFLVDAACLLDALQIVGHEGFAFA